jgi:hypothetical protein
MKTTTLGRATPFFVGQGDLSLSAVAKERLHLYCLLEFHNVLRMFDLAGRLDQHCLHDPVTYRAAFS